MQQNSGQDTCAEPAIVMTRITAKWRPSILRLLHDEPRRFGALRSGIPAISERMLVYSLRELERDGIVLRTALSMKPPHVIYSLTAFGAGCARHIEALLDYLATPSEAIASTRPPPRER
jgi:DNA-binding HxlR family transcriptional regulator